MGGVLRTGTDSGHQKDEKGRAGAGFEAPDLRGPLSGGFHFPAALCWKRREREARFWYWKPSRPSQALPLPEFALLLRRKELYANLAAEGEPRRLVSLEDLGRRILMEPTELIKEQTANGTFLVSPLSVK